jgi:hypothetical protein
MRRILVSVVLLTLQACTTTDPGESAAIDYHLPRTDAKVTLSVDVTQCKSPVLIKSSLKIDAVAGVQDGSWHVSGAELSSEVTKRSLTINVDDNNVISSVNATSTDQGVIILGNVIKLAATVASAAGAGPTPDVPTVQCTEKTAQALANLTSLQTALAVAKFGAPGAKDGAAAQKQVDALAAMVATAQAALHQDVTATIKLEEVGADEQHPYVVAFDRAALSQLFDAAYFNPHMKKNTPPGMNDDSIKLLEVDASIVWPVTSSDSVEGEKPSPPNACSQSIVLPAAKALKLVLTPKGSLINGKTNHEVSQIMYASQLGTNRTLCISAGFGENRTVGLKFDKFGRATEFSWSADARAANITSALAGAAPDASTVATKVRDLDLTREKSDLDKLTTGNSLQMARQCQAILDAGGTTCPK